MEQKQVARFKKEAFFMVHPSWFPMLRKRIWDRDKGGYKEVDQPDYLAAVIMGYVVRASRNGKATEHGVCITYRELMQLFGATKSAVKSATNNLVHRGLVERTFHTVELDDGVVASNVMFLKPNMEEIEKITTEGGENTWRGA